VYHSIIDAGHSFLQVPIETHDFFEDGLCIKSYETRVFLEFKIDGDVFEQDFQIWPHSQPRLILGTDFLLKNQIIIDYNEACFWKGTNDNNRRYAFTFSTRYTREIVGESETFGGHTEHSTDAPMPPRSPCLPAHEPSFGSPGVNTVIKERPLIYIEFGESLITALVDTGAQMSIISEEVYQSIVAKGCADLQHPVKPVTLHFPLPLYTQTVATKVHLQFKIDGDVFEQTFLVTPQFPAPVILGSDFCQKNKIILDFYRNCFRKGGNEDNRRYSFDFTQESREEVEEI
jgi:predicted aspartyl protease